MKRRRPAAAARPAARPDFRNRIPRPMRGRAGLIMSPRMDFGVLEAPGADMEAMLVQEGLRVAPMSVDGRAVERCSMVPNITVTVIPTAGVADIEAGGLACVVVPGNPDAASRESEAAFDMLVSTAQSEDVPVLAFGDGVARSLAAVGFEPPADPPPAILIHHGLRILETTDEVRDAVRALPSPTRRAA